MSTEIQNKLFLALFSKKQHLGCYTNAKMVRILNVDLDEWNNIGIHDFSSRDSLGFRKPVRGYKFFQNSKLSASNLVK